LQFTMGAVMHTIGGAKLLQLLSDGQCDTSDVSGTLRRMEAFLLPALTAPVPAEVQHAAR
jgi:hypothetical protein